jgi:hypothetical protein
MVFCGVSSYTAWLAQASGGVRSGWFKPASVTGIDEFWSEYRNYPVV